MAEGEPSDDASGEAAGAGADVPREVVDEAERLTRLARAAVDEREATAYRTERDELLGEYGYETRVREDDDRDIFVAYPAEWMVEGVLQPSQVEDVDRGIERPLSGAGDPDDWDSVADHNDALAERVTAAHDEAHAANARALADFASNHYAKPIEDLTRGELESFVEEYFPRNAWPTDRQAALLTDSIRLTYEKSDARCPLE